MNKIINGVWSGPELSDIEKLSIRSFLDNGHEFHLWLSEPCKGVPEGTLCRDTNEIVPSDARSWFWNGRGFSDYFRALLIYKLGGWYSDVDIVCLRPFDFEEEYVFTSEPVFGPKRDPSTPTRQPSETPTKDISGCIFKAPAGSPFLKWMLDAIVGRYLKADAQGKKSFEFYKGFELFREGIPQFGLESFVRPPITLDALSLEEYPHFINSNVNWNVSEKSYAMHLRRTCWSNDFEKWVLKINGRYPSDSLYEQLKKKHGVQ